MTEPPTHVHAGGAGGLAGLKTVAIRKVGPLPLIAWLGIAVAAYVAYHYLSNRGASATSKPDPNNSTSAIDGSSNGGSGANDGGGSNDQSGIIGSGTETDAQWTARVVNWLIGQGVSPSAASNAMSAYVNGEDLTPEQVQIVNKALAQFGSPPQGVLPVHVKGNPPPPVNKPPRTPPHPPRRPPVKPPTPHKPPPKKGPKPPPTHKPPTKVTRIYVVRRGDSLSSIARHFYGNDDWHKIYDANRGVIGTDPNKIHPGEKLRIPA